MEVRSHIEVAVTIPERDVNLIDKIDEDKLLDVAAYALHEAQETCRTRQIDSDPQFGNGRIQHQSDYQCDLKTDVDRQDDNSAKVSYTCDQSGCVSGQLTNDCAQRVASRLHKQADTMSRLIRMPY